MVPPAPPLAWPGSLTAPTRPPEPDRVQALLAEAQLSAAQRAASRELAQRLISAARQAPPLDAWSGPIQALLHEFELNSAEGMALMGLAEALLRIPDRATRDALIREKIAAGHWRAHWQRASDAAVQAVSLGLMWSDKMLPPHGGVPARWQALLARGGGPLIRRIMDHGLRRLGAHFVTGETIHEALERSATRVAQGFRYSFDMLGEAAMTQADARRYHAAYAAAISAMAQHAPPGPLAQRPGISIKLSALHPRFSLHQHERVMHELYPRLYELAEQAAAAGIGLNIDAEESERLTLTLALLERLGQEPTLRHWPGLGTVVQAYQKRAAPLIDRLISLARQRDQVLMVRLVKGAYWDGEIKRCQQEGLSDYPVFTRKPHTDVSYLACARRLLAAGPRIYPQFATHNAQTVADVMTMAGLDSPPERYEFQCLHGMGEALYGQVVRPPSEGGWGRPCRIYAPVGAHDTLLAYLVRRLLENGANSSFVHQLAHPGIAIERLLTDPVAHTQALAPAGQPIGTPHPAISLPAALYGPERVNAPGLDLYDPVTLTRLADALQHRAHTRSYAAPAPEPPYSVCHAAFAPQPADQPITNPARRTQIVGWVREATPAQMEQALVRATQAQAAWAATAPARRAACLRAAADRLVDAQADLIALLILEAGKTHAAALAEVREAIDFLRYDAAQIGQDFDPARHPALGPVACISPWNFPLAIFIGQVAAALAAGNTVLAKPAEQTPLIAACAVAHLHAAGIPPDVVQLLPGSGPAVGAALAADPRVQGVVFTGSGAVARQIQATLAQRLDATGRPVTLIAETGGLNAMVVDSSALPEQVVSDVLSSAFDSAGQRCSALRILCLQEEVAGTVLALLRGAMAELHIGDPSLLATDIGPVIDAAAHAEITAHIAQLRAAGWPVWQAPSSAMPASGAFIVPTLIEVAAPEIVEREIFGPVLHVVRYRAGERAALMTALRRQGYGLTFGVHSRIERRIAEVVSASRAGNVYINRNMIGAVVGVQPFGGEGLSGTGPKAGGPLYLLRLLADCPAGAARRRIEASGALPDPNPESGVSLTTLLTQAQATERAAAAQALEAFLAWSETARRPELTALTRDYLAHAPVSEWRRLPGPTGQADLYCVSARSGILGLADTDADRLTQLAAVLALGATLHWPESARLLYAQLPAAVQARIQLLANWRQASGALSVVIQHAPPAAQLALAQELATRPGPIVALLALAPGSPHLPLERLVQERSLSLNTAAAGGNASLVALRDPEPAGR